MWLIFSYALRHTKKTITICRKTYPALRTSAMRDFIEILRAYDLYDDRAHNKSSGEYRLNNNVVEFISLDAPQKVRGRKRDILFINEANELHWEDWQQLVFRTSGRIYLTTIRQTSFIGFTKKLKPVQTLTFILQRIKTMAF